MNIDKCSFGGCEHTIESLHEETHLEGVCWKITKPDLENELTNEKYCPCTREKGLIRRYDINKFMSVEKHDQMIPKPCSICNIDALFRVDEDVCMPCKTRADYDAD